MALRVRCGACAAVLQTSDRWAGKLAHCPRCRRLLQLPSSAVADRFSQPLGPETPYDQRRRIILGAFQGSIDRAPLPWKYRLASALVALFMVLLPLVYVALIIAVAAGVCWHAVHNTSILRAPVRGYGYLFVLLLYIAPMVIGGIAVLFMVKPLFARPVHSERGRSVTPTAEPLLFDFVDRICQAVGARRPSRIDVDCQLNASASFRRGLLSFTGHDLVLTIGMPLVAGLTLRQLAGVLAHEFGHFSQGTGMRLTYIVRSIAYWFSRVVYERDVWDQWLHQAARSIDFRVAWVLFLAEGFVWLSRRVLAVLMLLGHGVASSLLRQMELDADRHEARLAGSDNFAETTRRLRVLEVAMHGALSDLEDFYREGKLGDNLPKLVVANVQQIPAELLEKIETASNQMRTGWLDTHPADPERIANARREQAPGVFHLNAPATLLFRDFDQVARAVTVDYYRAVFGSRLDVQQLRPVEELLDRQQQDKDASQALNRFFAGQFLLGRAVALPPPRAVAADQARRVARTLTQARKQMVQRKVAYQQQLQQWIQVHDELLDVEQAQALLEVGIAPARVGTRLFHATRETSITIQQLRIRMQQLETAMAPWERLAAQRLEAAISLLLSPAMRQKPQLASSTEVCRQMLPSARALLAGLSELHALQKLFGRFVRLLQNAADQRRNEALVNTVVQLRRQLIQGVNRLRSRFRDLPYPFDHASANMTVARFLLKDPLLDEDDWVLLCESAHAFISQYAMLTTRVLAQLTQAAEALETALGLKPLPDPPPE